MPSISKIKVFILFLFIFHGLNAQEYNNLRTKRIHIINDTIVIDTLSIIPESITVSYKNGLPVTRDCYVIDNINALLIVVPNCKNKILLNDTIVISYRVYSFMFTEKIFHKEHKPLEYDLWGNYNPYIYSYSQGGNDLFRFAGLSKNGSISRGISFGNNQDVIVNSGLNLQLSGRLNEEVSILAAITDNNIPIQPEGNTQQIQEFDKVYIQLFTENTKLTAGDFEITRPYSKFMNLNKKGQGGLITSKFYLPSSKKKQKELTVTGSGAIAKGKYTRNFLQGVEGNQGPYKLTGINGETYIIILAGSEKVYIDGKQLTRGADNDYVIDYNLGEITFTTSNLITKDKRIVIEFEYSDRNYARSMFYVSTDYQSQKTAIRFNFFSEQDIRNQPVQQELSEDEKQLMYDIGDNIEFALSQNIDSIAFNSNEVLYKMIDTTVNSIYYDSVFVYSTSSDSAFYRLGFSNVGSGNGNYVQVISAANGRVFQWVAPDNGIPQGNYEPVRLIIAPQKTQMITFAIDHKLSKNTNASLETALSNKDINTFSPFNSDDDIGVALHFSLNNRLQLGKDSVKGWAMISGISHDYIQQDFTAVERFRNVEFERDWNLNNSKEKTDEQNPGILFGFENKNNQFLVYELKSFLKGSGYQAFRHSLNGTYDINDFYLHFTGSYLTSETKSDNSEFIRHKTSLSKKFKLLTLGVKEEQERNLIREDISDTLTYSAFSFKDYEAYITKSDSSKIHAGASYNRRYDYLPGNNTLNLTTIADNATLAAKLTANRNNSLNISATWRNLYIADTLLSESTPDNTILGKIEFFTRKLKKVITSNTFYEAGSGLEVKKEFAYVEVPAGQGLYSWTDYNNNAVKELDEFEIANFTDEACYIRVFTPTNDYIKAYSNKFSEVLNIEPSIVWQKKKGIRKLVSRFSLQTTYKIEHKTSGTNITESYNPFVSSVSDTALLSMNSSFRGALYFNRNNPKIGTDITYQDNRNKSLLVNGFDTRTQNMTKIRLRWNISKVIMFSGEYENGVKSNNSDYFSSKNYKINYLKIYPLFSLQTGTKFRISLLYKYICKTNQSDIGEHTEQHNSGAEIKYNTPSKGTFIFKFNLIKISYNSQDNNSISYEMLEGFKKGNNLTMNIIWMRNLSDNLQLNLLYDGRKTPGNKIIHVGSVQLRAHF